MIPPIATTISLLSRYWLALSLSSITDPIRDKLDATVRHFSHLVGLSTIAVAVGVLLEGVELIHASVEWRKRKRREKRERIQLEELRRIIPVSDGARKLSRSHPEEPTWAKLVLRIGLILVVIGVVGEWRNGAKLEDAHEAVHEYDLAKLTEAVQQAHEAAISARTAREEADAIAKQADAQGPRAKLLMRVAPDLAKRLTFFAGQRVRLYVCGQQGMVEQETLDTWGTIANILGPDTVLGVTGAGWKEVPTNLNWASGCGASKGLGQGVGVMVSKTAPKRVLEAATVLGHGLAKALPPSPNKSPGLIDPDFARMTVNRGFMPKDAPWTIVAFDQDLIVVVIGEHP